MKKMLLTQLINVVLSLLTPELLKSFVDIFLDWIEDFVAGTKSDIDDRLVLPLCGLIRVAFDIPDGDDEIKRNVPEKLLDEGTAPA